METMLKKLSSFSVSIFLISLIIISINCSEENSSTNTNTDPNTILIQGSSFQPAILTVNKGTTVTWINKDSFAHTVTSGISPNPDGAFNSSNISKDQSFTFKFDNVGSFDYFCMIHLSMNAKIIVN